MTSRFRLQGDPAAASRCREQGLLVFSHSVTVPVADGYRLWLVEARRFLVVIHHVPNAALSEVKQLSAELAGVREANAEPRQSLRPSEIL